MATHINVILEVKEIVFDIQNKAFLIGQAREAEGANYEAASNMQVCDDEENSYQIRRSLTTAFAQLKSMLGEYINNTSTLSNNKLDCSIDINGTLALDLNVPNNFNTASIDVLGSVIHDYLVDKSLADWFAINSKSDADIYLSRSIVDLDIIKRALNKRNRPERPKY